jgi:UDP-N-acetylmuramate dehydrogenase
MMMVMNAIPATRGRLAENAELAPMTWFRVGGPAEFLLRPADVEDLCAFLKELPLEMPVTVIGAASNLIIRDGGVQGVVIKLARGFGEVVVEPDGIIAGAAALDITVAEHAAASSFTGLEFLSGIPGTIGGAVAMNAGAYGSEIAQVLDWAEIVTRSGELVRVGVHDLGLSYRHANLPADAVVVRARLRAHHGEPKMIAAQMQEIKASREASQPVRARTGGSTFANPPGQKAWELVDAVGGRGLRRGGAQVSELHCNFLLNTGDATAADLEGLGEELRRRVAEASGIALRWEIKRIGVPA